MTPEEIAALLTPYAAVTAEVAAQLAAYLELILKWNAREPGSPASNRAGVRVNLTAIRRPEEIVRRHFGESLFVAAHVGECQTLLDFGSGAGFPGLPIQLARPELRVTLAESRTRKAAFLREAVRTLGLTTEVWADRVEAMPSGREFDIVTLRAVDDMGAAVQAAGLRAAKKIMILTTLQSQPVKTLLPGFRFDAPVRLPESEEGILLVGTSD